MLDSARPFVGPSSPLPCVRSQHKHSLFPNAIYLERFVSSVHRFVIVFIFAGICSYLPPFAWAGEAFLPVTPEEVSMTREPKAPGAPAIYLYRQVDRDDTRSGHVYNYLRIKILTEEGRKYADVDIPFDKEQFRLGGIKARTIQPDGTTTDFNGKIYEKMVVKAKGLKYLAKTFTLPDVRAGTIIDYSYTVETINGYLYDSRWILSADLFTKKAKFSLVPNADYGLMWSWPNGLPQGAKPPTNEGKIVRLETEDVPAFQVEDYMPPENALKFRIDFTYTYGDPETDETKFWKKLGKEWNGSFEKFVDKKKAMEQAVSQIVSAGDSPEAKLQKIYARVLQLRNTSFDREKTAQEEKREKLKDINNVEDVLKYGYGSARAINWLFIALARAAGVDAHCVYVSSRSNYFFSRKSLNPDQLNADVVLVKLQGKDLYLDPASKFAPFGVVPWYETDVDGMLLDKDGGTWVHTSGLDSSFAKIERKADLTLADDGTLEGTLVLTLGGMEALAYRSDAWDDDDASRKSMLEDAVKEAIPATIEVELTNKPDWNSASPTLVAEFHLKVPGWAAGAGRRVLLPVGLFCSSEKHVFEHANRTYAVYFHHPYQKIDDINVALPLGWSVGSVPQFDNQEAPAVGYVAKVEDKKGSLHISRKVRVDAVYVPKDKYPVLREFYEMVRSGDDQQVVLQPAS